MALLPARMVIAESDKVQVGGTIWNGEAVLASTIRVDWQVSLLRSLTSLALSADFRLIGGATDLAGSATKSGPTLTFRNVSGQMDEALFAALNPNLPISCRYLADVDVERLVIGGSNQSADATLQVSPATCSPVDLAVAAGELPASTFTIVPGPTASSGALVARGGRARLLEVRLARDGALSVWPTALATQFAPFLAGVRYDTKID